MKSIILYVIIAIGALGAIVIPILFVPSLLQQITYFPEDDPFTIVSCAEQIIANCQTSYISLSRGGALGHYCAITNFSACDDHTTTLLSTL